jgi:hypothetical protein
MQFPKLKVLAEAGAVRDLEVNPDDTTPGWTVQVIYTTRSGERSEALERQRGGVRVFATLDAVARCLAGLSLSAFRVNTGGLAGEEPP